MIRLIIPQGQSYDLPVSETPATSVTLQGPAEIVIEGMLDGSEWRHSGEYLRTSTGWHQTLPYLREEMGIALPLALVMSLLCVLSFIRKYI